MRILLLLADITLLVSYRHVTGEPVLKVPCLTPHAENYPDVNRSQLENGQQEQVVGPVAHHGYAEQPN